jgi:hypothetical protein
LGSSNVCGFKVYTEALAVRGASWLPICLGSFNATGFFQHLHRFFWPRMNLEQSTQLFLGSSNIRVFFYTSRGDKKVFAFILLDATSYYLELPMFRNNTKFIFFYGFQELSWVPSWIFSRIPFPQPFETTIYL